MSDEQKKLPTERVFQLYGDEVVSLNLNITNITKVDKRIIFEEIVKDPKFLATFKFKEIEKRLNIFMDAVKGNAYKPDKLDVHITGDNQENVVNGNSKFRYHTFYFSPISFPFLFKQNSLWIKYNYALYNGRFAKNADSNALKEDEVSAGVFYTQKANKRGFSLSNSMFFDIKGQDLELETKFTSSWSDPDIKRKQSNSVFKTTLAKNFNPRPFIFRENYIFDEMSKLNLQYAHKIINSYVDEYNCSSELISKLPQEDSQHHLKLFYIHNFANVENQNVSYFKVSSNLINSLNNTYVRSKVFYRKFFYTNPITYQFNLEMGNVANLKRDNSELRIHERLFVHNFRGVVNPSRKVIVEEGKTGDSLGNTTYLMVSNKVKFTNIPIFNNFNLVDNGLLISPFIHFNLLWTPDLSEILKNRGVIKSETTQAVPSTDKAPIDHYDPLHLSAGFGISMKTQWVSLELYYNAYVKKNSHDVGKEFSIKFGLD